MTKIILPVCLCLLVETAIGTEIIATDSAAFLGDGTQDVSSSFIIRDNFYENGGHALAYLRFEIDATAQTIGDVAFDDIASVTLDLDILGFNGSNTGSSLTVWALNDGIASPEPGGLTETTWTELNFLRDTAPHGNSAINSGDGVILAGSIPISAGAQPITLDQGLFQTFLDASTNDEISLAFVGEDSARIPTIGSANNVDTALRPTLTIVAIPEPSSLALFTVAMGAAIIYRRRR